MSLASLPPGADLSKIPAGMPPAGVTPNFVDPENLVAPSITINAIFILIALAFVTTRIYIRFHDKSFGWDDGKALLGVTTLYWALTIP